MLRVLIVSDVRLYREGLAQLLGREAGMCLVGAASDVHAALRLAAAVRPDVALVDQALAGHAALVGALRAAAPRLRVVLLASWDARPDPRVGLAPGVATPVSRDAGTEELFAIMRGERPGRPRSVTGERLTGREREIVGLLERGFTNKDIARRLGIEIATVKNHVHHVLEKLRVRRRGQAAARIRGVPRRLLGL